MYSYVWDKTTHGYVLTTQSARFIANEVRPVFAQELLITGLHKRFEFDHNEKRPLLWAQKNMYFVDGEKVAQINNTQYGKPLSPEFYFKGKRKLESIDIAAMIENNADIMSLLIIDTKRRVKELFDSRIGQSDLAYIAFSGGKDSVVLLDICHKVLPLSAPVVFSDTDMELPDTYSVWEEIQERYSDRVFYKAMAKAPALENWKDFGPPSRTIRWCCSVHKSAPALILLKEKLRKPYVKLTAFVGVRGEESHSRSMYEDNADEVKNASQFNCMPLLDWGAHELWLYVFANNLLINEAYKKGFTRVGCLLCPESSAKYEWFVESVYPGLLTPYNKVVINTSNKNFKTVQDKIDYVGSLNWQARKSGVVLKETISSPTITHDGMSATFHSPYFSKDLFFEWIKTIGEVVFEAGSVQTRLKLPNTLDDGIPFSYNSLEGGGGQVSFDFRSVTERVAMMSILIAFMKKAAACIACRSCEAQCKAGAIGIKNGKLKIDAEKCIKCHKCYDIDNSCWRYMSMRLPEKSKSAMVSINTYKNFGLREKDKYLWVSALVELGDRFFPWHVNHPLGNKMVESARNWFIQAGLINEHDKKPTQLVDLFRQKGTFNSLGWEFIWMAIVNRSILVKWFITATTVDIENSVERLHLLLNESNPNLGQSTIEGGLAALKDMLTKSPLGGENAVTCVEMKGKNVESITRKAKTVDPLTILYGLYLIAEQTGRSSFTIRELITADIDSFYVSPIAAFGLSPITFKQQCEGLRTRFPKMIETVFTHGNDELTIFPDKYSIIDVIAVAIEEK
ncbi:MAG: phosphoadenosine phosphosulfate reductase family protein [Clostridiales bacterium]|jgi:3'-phosphoadenosine 5'-phosphosulfate sulfotransferase (PAPS reductase)/FAD synthetase/ferredoxin|nr:phosphoadenosine phosphosulfate reductase family protein [Clostridiales bacterium]